MDPDALDRLRRHGVDFFQLRDRVATDREFEAFLERVSERAPELLSRILVNDRLAVAATFPVAGVHLPEAGLPASAVRARFPRGRLLIGRSVHSLSGAIRAAGAGSDYLILGPFAPTSDPVTGPKVPLERRVFERTTAAVGLPVWAIGGIGAATVGGIRGLGLSGFAAIRGLSTPERVAKTLSAAARAGIR